MPFARFHTQPLFYQAHLDGPAARPPLVLIHGAGGDHRHWPPEARALSGMTVYTLDLPGHGQSGGAPARGVADLAGAVLALLEELGVARAMLAGHSLGGAVALTLALEHPERLAGLGLLSTGARLRVAPEILAGVQDDRVGTVARLVEAICGPAASEPVRRAVQAAMLACDPAVLLGDWLACDAFDVRDRLGAIQTPTQVAVGEMDRMTPERSARFLTEHIPGARLTLYPGAGHMLPLEQPLATAEFLRGLAAP